MMTEKPPLSPELVQKLDQLSNKYAMMGQDIVSYLEGLFQADYLTYWDYIHLETLLSLQSPRTAYPDELIFITYHQCTELYFKLILHEIRQIADRSPGDAPISSGHPLLTADFFAERLQRINRYFDILEHSYAIMVDGMEKNQFLKFRMALLPSSGFQSVQFREIEIASTDIEQLMMNTPASTSPNTPTATQYDHLYWKWGATELATQQKTLTLKQFEAHYSDRLIQLIDHYRTRNLYQCFKQLRLAGNVTDELINQLREYDHRLNIRWKLSHLRSAVRYLQKKSEDIKATGGTNWQKYLPPHAQQRIFYPDLLTETERNQWGKVL